MLTPSMRNWFGRSSQSTVAMLLPPTLALPDETLALPDEPMAEPPSAEAAVSRPWCDERLSVSDALWGEGYQLPGGEMEVLRLAKPLGLSAASSLLLLGAGSGGAANSLVSHLGVWVNGFEADADLAAAATHRVGLSGPGKRVRINRWDPSEPVFTRQYFHHALAIEPLRGHPPETILAALSLALKEGGQLMMVELVADAPLSENDPLIRQWGRLERIDPRTLPTEIAITRVLGRLGFDVRIVEDVSQRHMHQAIMGWRRMVRGMEDEKPSRAKARLVVHEAELWLLRLRLFREGRLRLVRWHAIGSAV